MNTGLLWEDIECFQYTMKSREIFKCLFEWMMRQNVGSMKENSFRCEGVEEKRNFHD